MRWWRWAVVALALVGLGLTARFWGVPFFAFLGAEGDTIQTLSDLIAIVAYVGTIAAAAYGFVTYRKAPSRSVEVTNWPESPQPMSTPPSLSATPRHATTFRVFVSSTWLDLQPEREAVEAAIHRMRDAEFGGMEYFGARPETPRQTCLDEVDKADVYVGIFAHRYGSLDPETGMSMTELEYRRAKERGVPCLIFIKDKSVPVPLDFVDLDSDKVAKLAALKKEIGDTATGNTWALFKNPDNLATHVATALPKVIPPLPGKPVVPSDPVDVLSQHPDLSVATETYLSYLVERYRYLELKGMGMSDRVALQLELTRLYVPLKARAELPKGDTWARDLRVAGRALDEAAGRDVAERLSEPVPILDLLRDHDGLIVLGDPGAGKTTFLKYLALQLAGGHADQLGVGDRLPLLVPISAFATALEKGEMRLDDFVCQYLAERCVDGPMAEVLTQTLEEGRALVLLDGLDEVRDTGLRRTVVQRVEDLYAARHAAGNKFVLTSRIVGYRDVRPSLKGLIECTLDDFDDEAIESFVDKWTQAIEDVARGQGARAAEAAAVERRELLDAVSHNEGVRRLAANPLLLTILALIKRQGMVLPDRRVELYDHYVRVMLSHWNRVRGLGRPPTRDLDVVVTTRMLADLALWMHESNPGVGLVQRGDLERKLRDIYEERGEEDPEKAALRFLNDVSEHAGLLLERGAGQYGFIHLTFEEYLAAVGIARLGQRDSAPIVERLAQHVGEQPWREVTLLTIGHLGIVQQWEELASEVVGALLDRNPGPPGAVAALMGEAVADAGGSVTPACRERAVAASLAAMRGENPYREAVATIRAQSGRVLARLGDPRDHVLWPEAMPFCRVQKGSFWMGTDNAPYDDEEPRHPVEIPYDYYMARYPVTNAQYQAFVDAGGYAHAPYWVEASNEGYWKAGVFRDRDRQYQYPEPFGLPNHPVVGVSWYEALAYSRWLHEQLCEAGGAIQVWDAKADQVVSQALADMTIRLPSETEWEKAARGPEGLVYPWGPEIDPECVNYSGTGIGATNAVGCFPLGAGPYGVEEMSGNVWEWCLSVWRGSYREGDEDNSLSGSGRRVVRGGSFLGDDNVRGACRNWSDPNLECRHYGFRLLAAPAAPTSVASGL